MQWYLDVLRSKYAQFTGRARRREYWMFVLFNILVSIALVIVDVTTGMLSVGAGVGLLSGLYSLAVFIPTLALMVRRLHDINRSGLWLLIAFVPLIGFIVLLIFTCTDGTPGDNQYGASPKAVAA